MAPPRFLINGRFLAKPYTGVTRVGRELLNALTQELAERDAWRGRFALAAPDGADFGPAGREAIAQVMAITTGPGSIPAEQLAMPFSAGGDVVVSFCNVTPLLALRSIIWIHDAHIFEAPETYGAAYRAWHTLMLRGSGLRGFRIVTVSDYSRDALIRVGAPAQRIAVISNGGDHILREHPDHAGADALGLGAGPFVLVMGSPAKHKNAPFAVRALLAGLPEAVKIAVVGLHQAGAYVGEQAMPQDARIALLPRITDGVLHALYQRAACVVVPSLLEGFGLPAAETLWAGGVLAIADATALPEVGGDAALRFDPRDAADIAAKTREAMTPAIAARLRAAAVTQRERFAWRRAARDLLALCETF